MKDIQSFALMRVLMMYCVYVHVLGMLLYIYIIFHLYITFPPPSLPLVDLLPVHAHSQGMQAISISNLYIILCLCYAEHIVHCTLCLSEATQSMYVLTQESVSLHCSLFLVYCLNQPHSQSQCPFQISNFHFLGNRAWYHCEVKAINFRHHSLISI